MKPPFTAEALRCTNKTSDKLYCLPLVYYRLIMRLFLFFLLLTPLCPHGI